MADQNPDSVSVDLSGIINLPTATESQDGLVELADVAETQAGVDNTQAVTPASAAATYVALSEFTAKGDLLTATDPNTPVALPVGTDGQILTACQASPTGLSWGNLPEPIPAILCSAITDKGALLTGSAPEFPCALTVGSDGHILTASSAAPLGLAWEAPAPPAIPCSCIVGRGSLIVGESADTPASLPVGANGHVLTVCSTAPNGLLWTPASTPTIPCATITGKGALVTGTAAGAPSALPVGSNGQFLVACDSAATGLCWLTVPTPFISCSVVSGKGAIVAGSASQTPTALPVGADGQVLHANSACPAGLEWKAAGGNSRTATALANAGIVAITMDNLRICFTSTGNRTWAFSTLSGNSLTIAQVTTATNTALATERRVATLNSTAFSELGGNFVCAASCATYLICMGPLNNPNAIYCFVGMTGCNYCNNFFSLTRLF